MYIYIYIFIYLFNVQHLQPSTASSHCLYDCDVFCAALLIVSLQRWNPCIIGLLVLLHEVLRHWADLIPQRCSIQRVDQGISGKGIWPVARHGSSGLVKSAKSTRSLISLIIYKYLQSHLQRRLGRRIHASFHRFNWSIVRGVRWSFDPPEQGVQHCVEKTLRISHKAT